MANIKHVGQIINTQRRCVVVFREVPDEEDSCLVVDTDALSDWMHDDVINAVESPGAQASPNFYEYAQRTMFTDGSNMLQTMNARNILQKVKTDNIMMTPNQTSKVKLSELNSIIKENNKGAPVVSPEVDPNQLGMAGKDVSDTITESADPALNAGNYDPAPAMTTEPTMAPSTEGVLGDAEVAKGMISQAEYFEGEASRLRTEAYALDETLKPKRGRPAKAKTEAVS